LLLADRSGMSGNRAVPAASWTVFSALLLLLPSAAALLGTIERSEHGPAIALPIDVNPNPSLPQRTVGDFLWEKRIPYLGRITLNEEDHRARGPLDIRVPWYESRVDVVLRGAPPVLTVGTGGDNSASFNDPLPWTLILPMEYSGTLPNFGYTILHDGRLAMTSMPMSTGDTIFWNVPVVEGTYYIQYGAPWLWPREGDWWRWDYILRLHVDEPAPDGFEEGESTGAEELAPLAHSYSTASYRPSSYPAPPSCMARGNSQKYCEWQEKQPKRVWDEVGDVVVGSVHTVTPPNGVAYDLKIYYRLCAKVTVHSKASGGFAAGPTSWGGYYQTFRAREECTGQLAGAEHGTWELFRPGMFGVAEYADGSMKKYFKGFVKNTAENPRLVGNPGPLNPPHDATLIKVPAGMQRDLTYTSERGSKAVISAGAKVASWFLDVELETDNEHQSYVVISIAANVDTCFKVWGYEGAHMSIRPAIVWVRCPE